jgi:intracellular sulfur oxidation DsrE/DsrF family protein
MIKKLAFAAIAILALAQSPAILAADAAPRAKEQVVIQVSDADQKKLGLALNVVGNIRKELGADRVDIEVVVFGPAITLLQADNDLANRVEDTVKSGVTVAACANSMRANNVKADDLIRNVVVVPAGVVEIMNRQRQGWLYLRP